MNSTRSRTIDGEAAAALIVPLTDLVVRAGAAILAVNRRAMKIEGKLDGSPVTEADLAADRIIGDGLAQLIPDIPAVSEERAQEVKPPFRGSFFLIDPLDGTKEFVAGRDEFTVNLALVTDGTPLFGIVGAPALGLIWRGLVGRGAERLRLDEAGREAAEPIHTRRLPARGEPWIAAVSRSHGDVRTEAFIGRRPGASEIDAGLGGQVRPPGGGRRPTSTLGWRRLPNGTSPPAMRSSPPPAARSPMPTARPLRFGEGQNGFIVPEFIAWGDPAGSKSPSQVALSQVS